MRLTVFKRIEDVLCSAVAEVRVCEIETESTTYSAEASPEASEDVSADCSEDASEDASADASAEASADSVDASADASADATASTMLIVLQSLPPARKDLGEGPQSEQSVPGSQSA